MKAIHQYLGMTEEQYEDMYIELFLNWAQHHITKCTDWQNFIANAGISKWFRRELSELEKDFVEEVSGFDASPSITILHYKTVYHRCVIRIHELFPKPKIEAAQKIPGCIPLTRHNGLVLFTYTDRN